MFHTMSTDFTDLKVCWGLCGCTTCSVHKALVATEKKDNTPNSWSNALVEQSVARGKKKRKETVAQQYQ